VDRFVYSIAAPRRVDPDTGAVYESVLRTVGEPITIKTLDLRTLEVTDAVIESATPEEEAGTIAVMGGADFLRWTRALLERGLLAPGARAVTFSYIGPEVTWPIYKDGTIGLAKADLERANGEVDRLLADAVGGGSNVSINKSVVTQASAAIPGVPLYMSLLFKVMKGMGLHEGTIEQMTRLFDEHFGPGRTPRTDSDGRIRLDDLEMRPDVQAATLARWERVNSANLREIADWDGYESDFRRLFGFGAGADEAAPVEIEVDVPAVVTGFGGS
jgi:enoyl-[acyl-carrier protein] reductase/trans-2-enoyl-CoA reductase (NAD+)